MSDNGLPKCPFPPSTIAANGRPAHVAWDECVREETKTHHYLRKGEPVQLGDIYGGKDWGFEFMVGSPQVLKPQPGKPCPGGAYRWRRPLSQ